LSTTLNENWLELKNLPSSTLSEIKLTYVKLDSIGKVSIIESKDDEGKEQHHILATAGGTKYLYKTEKSYEDAQKTVEDLIATIENPMSQDEKKQKGKLRLVAGGKDK
jgi:hypothetical protein